MAEEKYNPENIIKLIEKHKGNLSAVARAMRCARKTVHNYVNEHPEVADALKDAREEMTDIAESKLLLAIKRGDAWAVCFYLKTQGKSRGYIEKSQVDVRMDMSKLTDDELRSIVED